MHTNTKPCHNCRRRRLRCDRSWPSCHKCAVSGQECLGYGQLFVWTQAIDSSGNPKTASSSNRSAVTTNTKSRFLAVSEPALRPRSPLAPGSGSRAGSEPSLLPRQGNHGDQQCPLELPREPPRRNSFLDPSSASFSTSPVHNDSQQPPAPPPLAPPTPAAMAALTDPLFQDLDHNSRYYLAHFAERVCQDLVARDAPGNNPFRQLIPLANKHPLLLEIIVATSAMHWSNMFRPTAAVPAVYDPDGYLALLRSRDLVSRGALIDALAAKQRAMGHLRGVLDTLDPAGSEVVLAAMHFFVKFDLIDLERKEAPTWKTHLEGACSIMSLLTPQVEGDQSHRMLRDCVMADCFIYHILGSTLASGGLAARIARYAFDLLPVMKRVESNGYLSCPPEILQIILLASQLSHDCPSTDWTIDAAGEALALLEQALNFDIEGWASRLGRLNLADMESRVHMASAHRSAACLYILQALPLIRSVKAMDADQFVDDILSHLSDVKEGDPFFKATAWPTFIAGAETRDGEKRTWTLQRLLAIWETCPWGYIFAAIEMLKASWEMQDEGRRNNGGSDAPINWLQGLKRQGFDYLIV
ncbi:hypothetical protein S40288_00390 [Stachybotrys chartarum IBT 40288]|nr:hypothetical protein S40288_00390 [Stachybotrys chartarum IBT 40288]